jgi:hypothetical protein
MYTPLTQYTRELKVKYSKGFSGERLLADVFTGSTQGFTGCYAR